MKVSLLPKFRRLRLCASSLSVILALAASAARAQSVPTPPPANTGSEPATVVPVTITGAPAKESEVIVLSPFEVVQSTTRGYFAANTMSGTRFNTNLQDLGAAISVMTKEQMQDFGMLDINDVFLYSVGTEGTGTYSDFVMNRNGELTDNVSLSPTTANRVRGIAAANVSYGNFETMGRMPIDRLLLDSLEISRGPNANVFGLGNPSGTVNQVPVAANTTKNFAKIETRIDDWEGYRVSLDVNRMLIPDKLAVRFSALQATEAWVRKPSGMDTARYNGMVKFQPFKNTTITGSYLYYKSEGTRPNYTPPRDYVSYWISQGKPGWDPIRQMVVMPDGTTSAAFLTDAALFATPLGNAFNRTGGQFQRSNVFVDRFGITYWTAPTNNTGSTPAANTGSGATVNPDGSPRPAGFIRLYGSSPGPNGNSGRFTDQPLFSSVRSVTDSNIYDYENINLASPNFTWDQNDTYYVTIDQTFLNRPNHRIVGQAGFFREESERYRQVPIGDAGTGGQNGQLWVDVNLKNIDGSTNPNFGRPYIGVGEPVYSYYPSRWDTYRGQLAYQADFTQSDRWTKWLGQHSFSPYYEYKYRVEQKYSYREAIGSQHPWMVAGQPGVVANFAPANQANITGGPQAGPNIARPFYRFYVGDANGTNADYAPGQIIPGSYNLVWGTLGNFRNEPATLTTLATTNNSGGPNNLKRVIKTDGAVLHSQWWGGKFVTTFGIREDKVYAKQGGTPQLLTNNNRDHDFASLNAWENRDYRFSSGKTNTAQFAARPLRDLAVLSRWAESGNVFQRFFADVVQDATLTHNRSDNFIPSPPALDLFLNPLPNQLGKGSDWGAWLNLFDGKVVVRVNRYENKQLNARDGDANTIAQRTLRLDLDVTGDPHRLYARARDWHLLQNPTASVAAAEASALAIMKMSREQYDALDLNFRAGTIAAINDITAKGTEIEVAINPTKHWTVAFNVEEKKSINSNVSQTIQQWIDQRMPVWMSVVDPITDVNAILGTDNNTRGWVADAANPNHLLWLHRYGSGSQSPAENFQVNVNSPWSILRETQGKSRPQIRRYAARISTNLRLAQFSDHRVLKNVSVGGAVRWEDQASIGFYGRETYPAVITSLDPNRPIYDEARSYVDLNASYRTKLFKDRIPATFRLNVRNIQEGGRLQAVGAFPNGEIHSYRIIDPRQFILEASFDL